MLFDEEFQVIWEADTQGLRFSVGFVKHMKAEGEAPRVFLLSPGSDPRGGTNGVM